MLTYSIFLLILVIIIFPCECILSRSTLETNTYEVEKNITYEYVHFKGNKFDNNSKPTLLFLHGFPSSVYTWRHQIKYFSRQGYECLATNMMGYGKTYSPYDETEYKYKSMINHLIKLLNYLKIDKVIVIGHDWGTRPASRLILYHPERTLGLVLISIGYGSPGIFDLDQLLKASKEICGFEPLGYFKFFDSDDAAEIIENNLDSFIDIIYTNDTSLFKTDFAPLGKMREWLINGKRTTRASYMTSDDYKIVKKYLANAMQPKLNWYRAAIDNVNWNDEKDIDPTIQQPVLFIKDSISDLCFRTSLAQRKQFTPNLNVIELGTWHWVMEENPDGTNHAIDDWIKKIDL